jgi:chaperonin GroES
MKNLRVLDDRVLVKRLEEDEKIGGIIIPDSSKSKPSKGEIVAIGSSIDKKRYDVNIGDKVMFGKYSGSEVRIENEEHLVLKCEELMFAYE